MSQYHKQTPIIMPEYGRNVQNMVAHAITISDREARNRCAQHIVRTMMGLVPERREHPDSDQVYWDHLALISNFELDIDYPEGTITQEKLISKSQPMPYVRHHIRFRYYGHLIEGMIRKACEMPVGRERATLEFFIATQMKRSYMTWNSEIVDDLKIFKDLYELSQGQIMLTPENCKIVINPNSIDRGGRQRLGKRPAGNKGQGNPRGHR